MTTRRDAVRLKMDLTCPAASNAAVNPVKALTCSDVTLLNALIIITGLGLVRCP